MGFIKNKLFIFITFILLQSCSGGGVGKFFESSFKNIQETKIKEDVNSNLKKNIESAANKMFIIVLYDFYFFIVSVNSL